MKKILKNKLSKKVLAYTLVVTLVLGVVISADVFYPQFFAKAASSVNTDLPIDGLANPAPIPSTDLNYCPDCGKWVNSGHICPSTLEHDIIINKDSSTPTPSQYDKKCDICGQTVICYFNSDTNMCSSLSHYNVVCADCLAEAKANASAVATLTTQLAAANADIASKEQVIATKEARIKALESINSDLNKQITALTTERDNLKNENASLKSQIEDKNSKITTLNGQITDLNAEINALNKAIADKDGDIDALTKERDAKQKKIEELQALIESYKKDIKTLQNTIAEKDKTIASLNAEITSLKEGIKGLQAEIDKKNKEISDLEAAKKAKEDKIKELDAKIAANEGDIDALKEEKAGLLADIEDYTNAIANANNVISGLNGQIEDANKTITDLNGEIINAQNDIDNLTNQKDRLIDSYNETVNVYNDQIASKKELIAQLNYNISRNLGNIEELKAELASLTNDLVTLCEAKNKVIEDTLAEVNRLNDEISAAKVKETELNARLAVANGGIKELEAKVANLASEVNALTSENEKLKATVDHYTELINTLTKQFTDQVNNVVKGNGGYTYTYEDSDGNTGFVCFGGRSYKYFLSEGFEKEVNGKTVTIYKAFPDNNGDGVSDTGEYFYFYVAEDGVHLVELNLAGDIVYEEVSTTTVEDVINLVNNMIAYTQEELAKARAKVAELRAGMDAIYDLLKSILIDLDIDIPDDPTPDPNPTPDDNDDAKRIREIMQMVRKVADKYKELEGKYNKVSADYASVITAIYGTDEPSGSELTPEEVINQLQEEREEAKKKADELAAELTNVKAELASTENEMNQAIAILTDALEEEKKASGEKSDDLAKAIEEANGLNEQLQVACNQIKALRASLDAMNSFVKTLATALGLDNIEDTAAILASVNGLKEQVKALTEQNAELNIQLEALKTELSEKNKQIENLNFAVSQAYAAGYEAGKSAGGSGKSDSEEVKALKKQIEELNAQITNLQKQLKNNENSGIIKENEDLKKEVGNLMAKIKELQNEIELVNVEKDKLTAANDKLKNKASELWKDKNALNKQISGLKDTNKALNDNIIRLQAELNESRINNTLSGSEKNEPNNESLYIHNAVQLSKMYGQTTEFSLPVLEDIDNENISLLDYFETYTTDYSSNCEAILETSDSDKIHANAFFAHYFNNIGLLSNLGYTDVNGLKDDEKHALSLQTLTSLELVPTEEQKELIAAGMPVTVIINSDNFDDGIYMIIHESKERTDNYDVMILEANNNLLSFELQDLSPVSIARLSIVDVIPPVDPIEDEPAPMPIEVNNNKSFNMTFIVLGTLVILLLAGLAAYILRGRKISQKKLQRA